MLTSCFPGVNIDRRSTTRPSLNPFLHTDGLLHSPWRAIPLWQYLSYLDKINPPQTPNSIFRPRASCSSCCLLLMPPSTCGYPKVIPNEIFVRWTQGVWRTWQPPCKSTLDSSNYSCNGRARSEKSSDFLRYGNTFFQYLATLVRLTTPRPTDRLTSTWSLSRSFPPTRPSTDWLTDWLTHRTESRDAIASKNQYIYKNYQRGGWVAKAITKISQFIYLDFKKCDCDCNPQNRI